MSRTLGVILRPNVIKASNYDNKMQYSLRIDILSSLDIHSNIRTQLIITNKKIPIDYLTISQNQ